MSKVCGRRTCALVTVLMDQNFGAPARPDDSASMRFVTDFVTGVATASSG